MIETATLITLCLLFLIFFRPGKMPPLEKVLVIDRPGHYHLTLAPQLNLAQPFIEAVIAQFGTPNEGERDSAPGYFEVRDPQVKAHGRDRYLLARFPIGDEQSLAADEKLRGALCQAAEKCGIQVRPLDK